MPPEKNEYTLWDEVPGFGLRIRPTGVKSFILKYRTLAGEQRKLTLGSLRALTVEQARDLARDALVRVRSGGDPAMERRELRVERIKHQGD